MRLALIVGIFLFCLTALLYVPQRSTGVSVRRLSLAVLGAAGSTPDRSSPLAQRFGIDSGAVIDDLVLRSKNGRPGWCAVLLDPEGEVVHRMEVSWAEQSHHVAPLLQRLEFAEAGSLLLMFRVGGDLVNGEAPPAEGESGEAGSADLAGTVGAQAWPSQGDGERGWALISMKTPSGRRAVAEATNRGGVAELSMGLPLPIDPDLPLVTERVFLDSAGDSTTSP